MSNGFSSGQTPLAARQFGNGEAPRPAGKRSGGGPKSLKERWSQIIEHIKRHRWWYIGGGLALLVLIVLITVLVGRTGDNALENKVPISISGPERVALGSDVAYDIQINNDAGAPLREGRLLMLYPQGFSFTSAEPTADNAQGTEFAINDLEPGEGYSLRINGRLTGAVQAEQTFIARFSFIMEGSTQPLQVEATMTTSIETAAFSFTVDAPPSSLPGEEVEFDVRIENNDPEPLANLQVQATYPGGFSILLAEPAATTGNNIWAVDSLGIGQRQDISVTGTLGGNVGEIKRFVFEAGFLDEDGEFLSQAEVEKVVKLTEPLVTVTQTVNAQESLVVEGRESLEYTIDFKNTGPTGLANLVLDVAVNPDIWDLSALRVRKGGALSSSNDKISWDGVTVPELKLLEAGQSGQTSFVVSSLRSISVSNNSDKDYSTTTSPTITIGAGKVSGNAVTVKYAVEIAVASSLTSLSGPNPPQSGQESHFTITWTLSTNYADMSGVRLVGNVPIGAEFVSGSGQVSTGEDLAFNQAAKQVVWNIGNVPANSGTASAHLQASFRVRIVPAVNEVGAGKLLVTSQQFSGHDVWSDKQRTVALPDALTEDVE